MTTDHPKSPATLGFDLAIALDGKPSKGIDLPDGQWFAEAKVPSSRVPENLIHLLEAARRGLDDLDYDTAGAEMSLIHHKGSTQYATVRVVMPPQTGETET